MNNAVTVLCFDENDKKIKIDNIIRKELRKCYENSKYKGYPIILKGFLVLNKKNMQNLILYDIMLKDEYEEKIHGKRYNIRYENLNIRFINLKSKKIKSIFSHEFSKFNLEIFIKLFVKTLATDKIVYRKNVASECENEIVIDDIWTDFNGEIIGIVKDHGVKKEVDEDQNTTLETPFDFIKAFIIKHDDETIEAELCNYSESELVDMLEKADEYMNKQCCFKKYKILDNEGYVFTKII